MLDSIDERCDAELIERAQAGDVAAFGELVRRHQRAAIRVAAVALGSSTGSDDVAQEAFMKAHAALHRFKDGAPFEPWLFRIVTNTARNRIRRLGRQRALALRSGNLAVVGEPLAEEFVTDRADRQTLIEAVNRLGPADRLVLVYRWYDELSEAETADALGCRRGTVKSRLSRAMSRLRVELGEES